MVARVDPRTGALRSYADLAAGRWAPCSAARAGGEAWLACSMPRGDQFDPFGVRSLALGDGPPALGKPVVTRNGEAELRVSPSGGAMLAAACGSDEAGVACVRQPGGRWVTIQGDVDLDGRGAGPLADGRIAYLRELYDGDNPPARGGADADADAGDAGANDADAGDADAKRLHVATLGPDGKERALAAFPFTPSRGSVRVESPIQEGANHALRFVIEDGDGPFVVVVPEGGEPATAARIPDATTARLRGDHGIAVGGGHVLATLDGGATWSEVPAPPAALDAARDASGAAADADAVEVGELGARIGGMLRLGWGPPEGTDAAPPALSGPLLAPIAPPAVGPERVLACASAGAATGLPLLLGTAEAGLLLRDEAAGKAGRRDASFWAARIGGSSRWRCSIKRRPPRAAARPTRGRSAGRTRARSAAGCTARP